MERPGVLGLDDHILRDHPAHADHAIPDVGTPIPMGPKKARRHLIALYGRACQACGRRPPEVRLTVDHVIPKVEGGEDRLENYQLLCYDCNQMKDAVIIDFRTTGGAQYDSRREPHTRAREVVGGIPQIAEWSQERVSEPLDTDPGGASPDADSSFGWLTFTDQEDEMPGDDDVVRARLVRTDDGRSTLVFEPIDIYRHRITLKSQPDGTMRIKIGAPVEITSIHPAPAMLRLLEEAS